MCRQVPMADDPDTKTEETKAVESEKPRSLARKYQTLPRKSKTLAQKSEGKEILSVSEDISAENAPRKSAFKSSSPKTGTTNSIRSAMKIDMPSSFHRRSLRDSIARSEADSSIWKVAVLILLLVISMLVTAYKTHWQKTLVVTQDGKKDLDDLDIVDTEIPSIFDFVEFEVTKSFGTQCNYNYRYYISYMIPYKDKLKIVPVNYCKIYRLKFWFPLFRSYTRYIGKYIVDQNICYLFSDKEFRDMFDPAPIFNFGGLAAEMIRGVGIIFGYRRTQYMEHDAERFFYVDVHTYATTGCNSIPFSQHNRVRVTVNATYYYYIKDFLLGRCIVSSWDCGGDEYIPGLYSVEHNLCYYTTWNSAPKWSPYCEILCDRYPERNDVWYESN